MVSFLVHRDALLARLADLASTLKHWPWLATLQTLRERFREDRLGLTAGSLTFTTLIALVPLVTVMLAVFTAFPIFGDFQLALEKYFLQALVPETIAKPVMRMLTQFAGQANRLGSLGLLLLGATALALVLTIDRTLNRIWRVRRPRPIGQRVLVYWAALTLGPLALGVSLSLTSYALSLPRGLVRALPGGMAATLSTLSFVLLTAVVGGLFKYVPHTPVRWRHALAGGLFVTLGLEAAKEGLAWYVQAVPTFSALYGAFATVPILLLWVYLVWVIVLLGAVIAAYSPSLQMGLRRPLSSAGARLDLALDVLRELAQVRQGDERGRTLSELAGRLGTDPLRIEPLVETLMELDWVARLDESGEPRHVLLVDPDRTPATALVEALLMPDGPASLAFRRAAGLDALTLDALLRR